MIDLFRAVRKAVALMRREGKMKILNLMEIVVLRIDAVFVSIGE